MKAKNNDSTARESPPKTTQKIKLSNKSNKIYTQEKSDSDSQETL
jgi:hypothetical protein